MYLSCRPECGDILRSPPAHLSKIWQVRSIHQPRASIRGTVATLDSAISPLPSSARRPAPFAQRACRRGCKLNEGVGEVIPAFLSSGSKLRRGHIDASEFSDSNRCLCGGWTGGVVMGGGSGRRKGGMWTCEAKSTSAIIRYQRRSQNTHQPVFSRRTKEIPSVVEDEKWLRRVEARPVFR